jgi:hypothetical protein
MAVVVVVMMVIGGLRRERGELWMGVGDGEKGK